MTSPESKAKELIDKFTTPTKSWRDEGGWITDTESAKECAIICVKEILASRPMEPNTIGRSDNYVGDATDEAADYWNKVLETLNNMK